MDHSLSPVLCLASRLLEGRPAGSGGPEAVIETLSLEPRLRFATRLALVRLTIATSAPLTGVAPKAFTALARELDRLVGQSDSTGLAGLVALAPALRVLHETLESECNPLSIVPVALLELMRSRLH